MDSIGNLLQSKDTPHEPPQLTALREYVLKHHSTEVQTSVSQLGYTLVVPNAMLATTLRMELPQIEQECDLDKKLFIRIGHA